MTLQTVNLTPSLGVEVRGIDLRELISPELKAELRSLFFTHHLLLFRDQDITLEQQIAFMQIINKVIYEPELPMVEAVRVPMELRYGRFSNTDKGTFGNTNNEFNFHADYMYTPQGALQALSLWAEVIEQQAATTWANMVNAVKALPDDLREEVRYLIVDSLMKFTPDAAAVGRDRLSERPAVDPNSMWPHSQHAVISHVPATGEEFLNVSEWMTSHVVGWDDERSEKLFCRLHEIAYAPENLYRHEWSTHDFVVWDNVSLQHKREAHTGSGERTLRRVVANPYELCEHVHASEADEWVPARVYAATPYGAQPQGARYDGGHWVYDT
jgi:taurine dioxygenase